jgi:hypothetical protein
MSVLAHVETKPALLLHDVRRRRVHHESLVARRALAVARVEVEHPARPFPPSIFLDQSRRDIGKSQSIWTASKMETAGSLVAAHHIQALLPWLLWQLRLLAVVVLYPPPPKVCASGSSRPTHRTANQRQNGRRSKKQRSSKWKRREAARERNTGRQPKHARTHLGAIGAQLRDLAGGVHHPLLLVELGTRTRRTPSRRRSRPCMHARTISAHDRMSGIVAESQSLAIVGSSQRISQSRFSA